jgi:dUTP pyrophosphatase
MGNKLQLKIKYLNDRLEKIKKTPNGDWLDLRSAITIELTKGEFCLIPLGVVIKSPPGYECHIAPRSSTFRNYGIIQTNGLGIVDESYCGPNDGWFMPVYATKDTKINFNDRICQFRIVKKMEDLELIDYEEVDSVENRGGHGSSGIK